MNIRHVRKKIKTVGNIKKITRAMELVAAVKMKKSQQKAIEGRPYQETLDKVVKKITQLLDKNISPLLQENKADKQLVILISTNKGLCGSFNFNLFKFCLEKIKTDKSDFIVVGKLGSFFLNKIGVKIIADYSTDKPDVAVSAIFQLAVSKFLAGEYGQIVMIYNQFISTVKNNPVSELLLPIKFGTEESDESIKGLEENYLIEPKKEIIIDPLLRNFIEQKIRSAVISSEAGEHSARMLAMKNATDNASHLIYELTLMRNRLRQEKITYELLDMITAKESVELQE